MKKTLGLNKLQSWASAAEREHVRLAGLGIPVEGFKPFYVNINAFAANAHKLIVMGLNPAGNAAGDLKERALGYIGKILAPSGGPFCSIIPGPNGEYAATKDNYAKRTRKYISHLMGWTNLPIDSLNYALVPICNMVPFRSRNVALIKGEAWDVGAGLGFGLIEMARPKHILLIGNSEKQSAWSVLRTIAPHRGAAFNHVLEPNAVAEFIKMAKLTWADDGTSTSVLAVPHPRMAISPADLDKIHKYLQMNCPAVKKCTLANPYLKLVSVEFQK